MITRCTTAESASIAMELKSCCRSVLTVRKTFDLIQSVSEGFAVLNFESIDCVEDAIRTAMSGMSQGNILLLRKGPAFLPSTEQKFGATKW